MDKITLIATAASGVEALVAKELKYLGYTDLKIENGKIMFNADISAICKTNIWLRCSERVYIKVGSFRANTFDELFEGTKSLPWEDWLPKDANFPVTGKCVKSKLMSISDCQSVIKKAVVERLKGKYGIEVFPETGARYKIVFSIFKDNVLLMLDTSGNGLHKRGYRMLVSEAPLKETLACALLMISWWKKDRALIDPFCGSGTIPIEAAMIALNIAPGLKRSFDSKYWEVIPSRYWKETLEEAYESINRDEAVRIQGSDISNNAIKIARYHARKAEVDKFIHLQRRDMKDISSRYKYGFIITNPPYGGRLGGEKALRQMYKEMGQKFRELDTWSWYILTAFDEFEKYFGEKADKNRKLYNGSMKCYYYQYFGSKPAGL